jgi:hypothetical protein
MREKNSLHALSLHFLLSSLRGRLEDPNRSSRPSLRRCSLDVVGDCAKTLSDAQEVMRLYRLRWRIEESLPSAQEQWAQDRGKPTGTRLLIEAANAPTSRSLPLSCSAGAVAETPRLQTYRCDAAKRRDGANSQHQPALFNHVVGAGEHTGRNRDTQSLCCLLIDDQLELGRLLNWQLGQGGSLRNPILDEAAISRARKGREGGLDRKRVAHVGGYSRRRFI